MYGLPGWSQMSRGDKTGFVPTLQGPAKQWRPPASCRANIATWNLECDRSKHRGDCGHHELPARRSQRLRLPNPRLHSLYLPSENEPVKDHAAPSDLGPACALRRLRG